MQPDENHVEVLPFRRPGNWVVVGGLRNRAHYCLWQVKAHDAERDRYFATLKGDSSLRMIDVDRVDVPNALDFFSDSAVLAAAMAVEMFLNHYGIVRLGEPFYKANYERLGAIQKLAAIVGTCCGTLVQQNDEIVQVTRRLFDRRNALVHPKSRDLGRKVRGPGAKHALPQQEAHDSVADMERFAALFGTFDEDAIDLGFL